jgi:DUF971 family protein
MTPLPNTAFPTEIRAPHGASTMEVDFEDGHRGIYPNRILRGFCPCAVCQGHHTPIEFRPGGSEVLLGIDEVGDYAIRLTWEDGHNTGIYSFPLLRALCSCSECVTGDLTLRKFGR